jgi:mRNA interferase HigB
MNVIKTPTIRRYQADYPEAAAQLQSWLTITSKAKWEGPEDVLAVFPKASILKDRRVVFNILGNRYRLIVRINYERKDIYVRFFGTHQEYDRIDANTV